MDIFGKIKEKLSNEFIDIVVPRFDVIGNHEFYCARR